KKPPYSDGLTDDFTLLKASKHEYRFKPLYLLLIYNIIIILLL
ncbi:unnamed protein product, partial [marine sediment metagenome]